MPLDPATRAFLDKAAERTTKPRHEMTPEEARAALEGLRALLDDGPDLPRVEALSIPVPGGELGGKLYLPSHAPTGLIAYFHGGGWVVGSPDVFEPLCRELAARTGCALAAVAYRRAPEHPFPGPVDDAWRTLLWLDEHRARICRGDVPLLVAGDSAGGNLAAAVTLRARAAGGPAIAAQLLAYPVTDCDFETQSYRDPANQLMLTREAMGWYWDHYAPDRTRRLHSEASPLRVSDLSGLPPAVILTAEFDVLRDEGEAFAERLSAAGVPVRSRCFDGQMHAFLMMVGLLPGSRDGLDWACAALDDVLSASPTNHDSQGD
ncbi:alpha/beta hydrolase [Micromonospora sp. STR1s_5]|nr:alpha/beta hydrolase [Micromonospora sp. STR1s_5]